jgi:cytoskeleton protein RodZ
MDESEAPDAALFPERVGDRLRAARNKVGLDLSDVATRTRIPQRHLVAIEAGDYTALPALTYCVGFVKSYARAVGEDPVELGRAVRAELGYAPNGMVDHADHDAVDPARVPTRTLALTALAIAVAVAGGYGLWRSGTFGGSGASAPAITASVENSAPDSAQPAKAVLPAGGQVVLTAMDQVWLQVDDDNEKALISGELKAGETFIVPATSINPRLKTSRADKIKVTVGGVAAQPLGPPETLIKNVPISAAALSARMTDPATTAAGGGPVPKGLGAPPAPGLSGQN